MQGRKVSPLWVCRLLSYMPTRRWVACLAIYPLPPWTESWSSWARIGLWPQLVRWPEGGQERSSGSLSLTVGRNLWTRRCQIFSIVRDEDPGDSKAANDTFPNEASDIFLRDSSQWFCLDPFGEVVDPYDKELELSYCHRDRSYYVQSLLDERPRDAYYC